MWNTFSSPRSPYPNVKLLLEFCLAHYLYPLSELQPSKEAHMKAEGASRIERRHIFIYYSDLVKDFEATVQSILTRFDLKPDTSKAMIAAVPHSGEHPTVFVSCLWCI